MTTILTCDKCGLHYRASLLPHECAEWTKGAPPPAGTAAETGATELQRAIMEHDDDMARLDRNTLAAPATDAGEWRVAKTGRQVAPFILYDDRDWPIGHVYDEAIGARIVADHVAVPLLVAVLNGLSRSHPHCWCQTWVGGEHEAECLAAQEAVRYATSQPRQTASVNANGQNLNRV